MISLLTGCRLADKEKGQTSEDLLIGFFVTLDYIGSEDEHGRERGPIYGKEKGDTYQFEDLKGYGMYFKMYDDAVSGVSDGEIRELKITGGDQFSLEGHLVCGKREEALYVCKRCLSDLRWQGLSDAGGRLAAVQNLTKKEMHCTRT